MGAEIPYPPMEWQPFSTWGSLEKRSQENQKVYIDKPCIPYNQDRPCPRAETFCPFTHCETSRRAAREARAKARDARKSKLATEQESQRKEKKIGELAVIRKKQQETYTKDIAAKASEINQSAAPHPGSNLNDNHPKQRRKNCIHFTHSFCEKGSECHYLHNEHARAQSLASRGLYTAGASKMTRSGNNGAVLKKDSSAMAQAFKETHVTAQSATVGASQNDLAATVSKKGLKTLQPAEVDTLGKRGNSATAEASKEIQDMVQLIEVAATTMVVEAQAGSINGQAKEEQRVNGRLQKTIPCKKTQTSLNSNAKASKPKPPTLTFVTLKKTDSPEVMPLKQVPEAHTLAERAYSEVLKSSQANGSASKYPSHPSVKPQATPDATEPDTCKTLEMLRILWINENIARHEIPKGLVDHCAMIKAKGEFHLFHCLPYEIRCQIWEDALDVQIEEVRIALKYSADNSKKNLVRFGGAPPALLEVNAEVRKLALKRYKPFFNTGSNEKGRILFNYKTDRLALYASNPEQFLEIAKEISLEERRKIHHIGVPLHYWINGNRVDFYQALYKFRYVRAIYFIVSLEDQYYCQNTKMYIRIANQIRHYFEHKLKRPFPKVFKEEIPVLRARNYGLDSIMYGGGGDSHNAKTLAWKN